MTTLTEPLWCPCCGSEARLVRPLDRVSFPFFVQCTNSRDCGLMTQGFFNARLALAAWNRRVARKQGKPAKPTGLRKRKPS